MNLPDLAAPLKFFGRLADLIAGRFPPLPPLGDPDSSPKLDVTSSTPAADPAPGLRVTRTIEPMPDGFAWPRPGDPTGLGEPFPWVSIADLVPPRVADPDPVVRPAEIRPDAPPPARRLAIVDLEPASDGGEGEP